MKKIKTNFEGLFLIKGKRFDDNRGFFREVSRENFLNKRLIFNIMSVSKKNVIRGLHIQTKKSQGKFISVLKGSILDVAVDLRKKSKTFGKHYKIILNENNCTSIYIPAGFAHGFASLGKENIVIYGCTNYRNEKSETGIVWNDKSLKIKWPIKKPILTPKDKNNLTFDNFIKLYY